MSASAVATDGHLVPFQRVLWAELTRAKNSASVYFPLAGLVLCLLQGLGWWGVATQPLTGWEQMFGWQSLYATALVGPLTALLVSLTVMRERRAREGGTFWRPVSPLTRSAGRAMVLAAQLCVLNFFITMPLLIFGWANGLTDAPVARLAGAWIALWLGSLLPAAMALVVARLAGMYAAVGVAIAAQVAGTMQAESSIWLWQPWTWPVHAVLPLLGIHANGTALESSSAVWDWNPALPISLSVALAVALTLIGVLLRVPSFVWPLGHTSPASSGVVSVGAAPVLSNPVVKTRPRQIRAVAGSLRGMSIIPLAVAAVVGIILTGIIWTSGYTKGVSTWLVMPLGTCLLACLAWAAQAPAWRTITLRASAGRLAALLYGCCLLISTVATATATLTVALAGGSHASRFGLLLWTVGATWLAISFWLATRFGAGAAIGLTLVLLVVGMLFGGTWMADTNLWLAGPLAWPVSADSWPRVATALALSGTAAIAALLGWAAALRRAARK